MPDVFTVFLNKDDDDDDDDDTLLLIHPPPPLPTSPSTSMSSYLQEM